MPRSSSTRAVHALTIGYSAFISEIVRQVILPQAIKNVLPPIGNEFMTISLSTLVRLLEKRLKRS